MKKGSSPLSSPDVLQHAVNALCHELWAMVELMGANQNNDPGINFDTLTEDE